MLWPPVPSPVVKSEITQHTVKQERGLKENGKKRLLTSALDHKVFDNAMELAAFEVQNSTLHEQVVLDTVCQPNHNQQTQSHKYLLAGAQSAEVLRSERNVVLS